MNALSLKGFFVIVAAASLAGGALIGLVILALGQPAWQALLFSVGGIPLGLMAGGIGYLVQLPGEIRGLHLPASEFLPGETLLHQTERSVVHYKTRRPGRFWEAVGGKLILTSHRLIFLAHRGQPYYYRVVLPLYEIVSVETHPQAALLPGMLRITSQGSRTKLFTFGAIFADQARQWSAAIGYGSPHR